MAHYSKAIVAFFTALGTWGATALADGSLDPVEWFGICGVIVATAGVFQVENKRQQKRDRNGRFVKEEG